MRERWVVIKEDGSLYLHSENDGAALLNSGFEEEEEKVTLDELKNYSYTKSGETRTLYQDALELLSEKIKKEILDAQEKIRELQNKVETLRKNCPHASYFVGEYSWRVGACHWQRICDVCGEPIGDPSEEEIVEKEKENACLQRSIK